MSNLYKPTGLFVLLIILALAARLVYAVFFPIPPTKDAADYDRIAVNLAEGRGYTSDGVSPTAFRPPLFPLFLAGVYSLFGHSYGAVRVLQAILGAASCVLIFVIVDRLYGRRQALLALGVSALYPAFVSFYYSPRAILSEPLFMFLMLLAFVALSSEDLRIRDVVFSGGLLGASCLIKGQVLFLAPLVALWILLSGRRMTKDGDLQIRRRRGLVRTSVFLLSFSVLPGLWAVRNFVVMGDWVPVSTNGGISTYASYNPKSRGLGNAEEGYGKLLSLDAELARKGWRETERSRYFLGKAWDEVRQRPLRALKLTVRRLLLFWDTTYVDPGGSSSSKEYNLPFGALFPFFILGMFVSCLQGLRGRALLLIPLSFFTLFHAVFHSCIRYRIAVEPFLIVFAAAGIAHAAEWFEGKRLFFLFLGFYFGVQTLVAVYYDKVFAVISRAVTLSGLH
jgi:4-amino-4-deoxy-L-arabinose transferase-like glycosyltransferase